MTIDPWAPPTPPAPDLGELVPLGRVVIKLDVSAQTTMPDTPNGYTAALKVMADQGDLDTGALAGDQGPAGDIGFQVREAIHPDISSVADLRPLPNTRDYIGRYFLLDELDPQGNVVSQFAYIWYGTQYRKIMMGAYGPPGPVPQITPAVALIPPFDGSGNPNKSYIQTSGPRLEPGWEFFLASPDGPMGAPGPLYNMPDVDEITNPPTYDAVHETGDLLQFTGKYTIDGQEIWAPGGLGAQLPTTWSMPESAFTAHTGPEQQFPIGSFTVDPAPPFPWTPIVWGHLGGPKQGSGSTTNSQQQITITGAIDGFFNLIFGGLTTGNLPWNATAAEIEAALENLASVGIGNIVGTALGAGDHLVEFVNDFAGQAVDQIGIDISGLLPAGTANGITDVLDAGGNLIVSLSNSLHQLLVAATGGTFTLSCGGETTVDLPFDATEDQIETALENLATVGIGNVIVTAQQGIVPPSSRTVSVVGALNSLIEFVGSLAGQALNNPIITDITNLLPAGVANAVTNVLDTGGNLIKAVESVLTGDPFRIGAQVLLGDPTQGIQVARGMGTTIGTVNIYPHYSSSANNKNKLSQALTPTNRYAVVPANEPDPARRTVYVNLWNDGQLGVYNFAPPNAQLFLMVQPMGPIAKPQLAAVYPSFHGEGFLQATAQRVIP